MLGSDSLLFPLLVADDVNSLRLLCDTRTIVCWCGYLGQCCCWCCWQVARPSQPCQPSRSSLTSPDPASWPCCTARTPTGTRLHVTWSKTSSDPSDKWPKVLYRTPNEQSRNPDDRPINSRPLAFDHLSLAQKLIKCRPDRKTGWPCDVKPR